MGARGESKTERAGETVPRPGDAAARRGTRGKWVVFALIPSLVALLLLEIAARVYERGTEERIQLVAPDELRHRDGEVLVYVYGESTVWGVPVTELGLVAQMQYLADRRSPGRRIRILNLGVPGIDSTRLRAFVEDTLGNRPDLAIVLCGHNEFLRAPAGRRPPGVLRHSALARVTSLAVAKFTLTLEDATPDGLTVPVDRTGAAFRRRQEIYRENMDAIARTAREQGVPVVLTSLPSNLADWPPVFRRLARADGDASYEPAMERALAADAAGDVNTLQSFVDEWQARAPDDAMVRFLRGRLRLWHGERRGAVEDLVFARDEDPIPWRMTSTLVASVRDVAARANAPFVDLADAVGEGDIPGSELILDNCHPSPEGAHRMALALLRAAEHAGLLPPPRGRESAGAGVPGGGRRHSRLTAAPASPAREREVRDAAAALSVPDRGALSPARGPRVPVVVGGTRESRDVAPPAAEDRGGTRRAPTGRGAPRGPAGPDGPGETAVPAADARRADPQVAAPRPRRRFSG